MPREFRLIRRPERAGHKRGPRELLREKLRWRFVDGRGSRARDEERRDRVAGQ